MKLPKKQKLIGAAVIIGTVGFSLLLVSIPSDTLIGYLGTKNAYAFVFLIAFLGSITTFASIPYPLILLSVVHGGLDPIAAGSLSALGVITSDICTFFAAQRGRALLSEKFTKSLDALSRFAKKHPRILLLCIMFYGIFSPVSNDFAVISLSLMRLSFWRVIPLLAIGNLIYNIGIAYLGVYAYDWITNLL